MLLAWLCATELLEGMDVEAQRALHRHSLMMRPIIDDISKLAVNEYGAYSLQRCKTHHGVCKRLQMASAERDRLVADYDLEAKIVEIAILARIA